MFQDRNYKRTFYSAPQSIESLIAAFLEPSINVLCFLAVNSYFGEPVLRSTLTLCVLIFALTFPGRSRFGEHPISAGLDMVGSWLMLLLILALCAYATDSLRYFETPVLMWWAAFTPLCQSLTIETGRRISNSYAAKARRAAVIVGAGALGFKVESALRGRDGKGIDFLGYFDDRLDDRQDPRASRKLLGNLNRLSDFVRAQNVRRIYITLPLGSQPRIVELLEQIQGTTASLYFVPDVFGISIIQGRLQDINGVPVVGICETPFTGTNGLAKRVSDVVLSSLILLLIAPVMLVVAIGVKISSPGAIIFRQRRNGLDGEEIIVYKFRSMRAEEDGKEIKQATKHDPRVTRFGAFIRRSSLDELPQFINVLQGRMSIVGPRPHAVAHNEEYRQLIKAYMVRHKVKPGITGWAQVNGMRGETDTIEKMKSRVEYDLEYLRNWSLALDLQIIVRTAGLVIFDRHAF
jgi:putative colanic acid biosynthesis UDP-glucose lipid carrier transferase